MAQKTLYKLFYFLPNANTINNTVLNENVSLLVALICCFTALIYM